MEDTGSAELGCGEVLVIQAGFFLQGSSASNLHSSFGILDYLFIVCLCIVPLSSVSLTLDL